VIVSYAATIFLVARWLGVSPKAVKVLFTFKQKQVIQEHRPCYKAPIYPQQSRGILAKRGH
jgi:hypothetical protein